MVSIVFDDHSDCLQEWYRKLEQSNER